MLKVSDNVVFESEFYRMKGKDAYLTVMQYEALPHV